MNSTLGIENALPNQNVAAMTSEQQLAKAKQVQTMGIIALILLATAFIPVLGFVGLIVSLVLSKNALKIGRDYLVPEQYEKPAKWASVISSVLLILSFIGLFMMIISL